MSATTTRTAAVFQLLQWKHAIRLEAKGIKVTRRSVRRHACLVMGLKPTTKAPLVLEALEGVLAECLKQGATTTDTVTFS